MRHIFAADIGGTHCRLAAFSAVDGSLRMTASHTVPTAQVPDTAALLQAFCTHVAPPSLPAHRPLQSVDILVVAVAGPLRDSMHATTTNAALSIDMHEALHAGCKHTLLCNDFAAQAWACCSPVVAQAVPVLVPQLKPAPPRDSQWPLGVIGAGTGLGTASLQPVAGGQYCVAAAEAGHTAFAFACTGPDGEMEKVYEAFLLRELAVPYISAEDVVSGRGLCRLHLFLTGEDLPASAIAAAHLHQASPTCCHFARFLGRVCRHWALSTLCRGGLYITGGVAMKNPVLVHCPDFAREFSHSPTCGELLRSIPVYLNSCEDSGLWGAATAGLRTLEERGD